MKTNERTKKNKLLRSDIYYSETIDRVWKALTDPKELSQWLMKGDFQLKPGHRFKWMDVDSGPTPLHEKQCEIQEIQVPHRLSFKITDPKSENVTFVTWILEPQGHGTHFAIEQEFTTQATLKSHPRVISLVLYRQHRNQIKCSSALEQILQSLLSYLTFNNNHSSERWTA